MGARPEAEPLAEAVQSASRALVGVAVRSINATGADVTLSQYRALVLIGARGPQRLVDLAQVLDVNRSTATRMCDRLVAKGLLRRTRLSGDRRTVRIALTPEARALVDGVTERRNAHLARILAELTPEQRSAAVAALTTFADAAAEQPGTTPRDGRTGPPTP
ncbi:MarR family transcriptional regulator [Nonomuraea antimicrobica]